MKSKTHSTFELNKIFGGLSRSNLALRAYPRQIHRNSRGNGDNAGKVPLWKIWNLSQGTLLKAECLSYWNQRR